jgi:P4 family phage/plasmid primase-like protien
MTAAANTSFPENSTAPPAEMDGGSTFPDLSQIRKYWDALRSPREIVELRYPTTYTDKKTGKIKSGSRNVRCSSPEELVAAIERIGPELTYWVNLQRMKQDTPLKAYGGALTDDDIERYTSLPIDYDSKRPGKVSATHAEKEHAHAGARELYNYFKNLGIDSTVIDSGSGFYVLPPIDLLNTPENRDLIARAIGGLKAKFYRKSSEGLVAKVDSTAVNPSRVFGLTGTMNAKGDSTPDRPHRPRLLLRAGSRAVLLSVAQLEEMASWIPKSERPSPAPTDTPDKKGPFTFDNVEQLFKDLEKRTEKLDRSFDFDDDHASTGRKLTRGPGWLVRCPHDSEHSNGGEELDGSTVVWMTPRGFPIFHCSHDGADDMPCNKMGWREFIAEWGAGDLQELITRPWNHPNPASTAAWLEGDAEIAPEPSINPAPFDTTNSAGDTDAFPRAKEHPGDTDDINASPVADASSVVAAPFFSDIALAKRFAQAAKGKIAFLDRGVWTYCANGRWQDDDRSALHIRHTVSEFLLQQMPVVDELIPKGADKEETANARMRRNLKTQLGGAAKESSVRSQVQHQPGMFLRADQFDKNPFLLGAPGGRVIDLTTGATRPARPEDYLSKSVVCLPVGDCPQWLKFMEEITGGDADLQDYLQRMMGYFLTAEVREHCLVVLHGEGGNGKGTLIAIVQHILGDSDKSGYACTVPMDALMTKKNGETDLRNVARMCGARLVVAQESDLQRKFNSGLLKTLTGGDELTGEKKFEHPFNFSPTHKLVVVSNHRPKVDLDGGMKRRLHLVPFRQVYDLDKTKTGAKPPDRMLKEKLLAEAPGILAWMIKGCLAWQKRGLDPPASVLDYTTEFFADNDTLGEWIEQNCDKTDAKVRTPNDDLFADWKMFCSNGRGDAGAHAEFVENLRKRGFEKARIGDKRATRGLKIKSTPYSM